MDKRANETITEIGDKPVLCWVHNPRYPEHHGLAFVIMQRIADACGKSVDDVLLSLKYETGRFDFVQLVNGETVTRAHSIAFESMPQSEFQKFWDETLAIIKERWVTILTEQDYEDIQGMITGQVAA
jgi:hypothetical protein